MGQYKVPQNVEAEDKIIGALTLKQFIYTVAGVMIGLVSFLTMRKTPIVMLIIGLPPTAFFLLLGLYQRQDQPFEALFLSLVSFMTKPRKRIWIKEPIEEVFKIEAPKIVKEVTQRDPEEVRGQLERLSQIVDTRGWSSKKAELQEPSGEAGLESEGRLVEPNLPASGEPIETDVSLADDILDFQNNPSAHNIGSLIKDQAKTIREEAVKKLHAQAQAQTTPPPDQQVSVGSSNLTTDQTPAPDATYQPTATTSPQSATVTASQPQPGRPATGQGNNVSASEPARRSDEVSVGEMTTNPLDDILKLAMDNEDLTVSQVAAQANRKAPLAEGQSVSLRKNGKS
ncbi:MAG TPA: PrgI family protein [Candidatus Saccharimonadales bacterium]|nr:PrgI family protein [Candidatus Saccharimonadales bacterium]